MDLYVFGSGYLPPVFVDFPVTVMTGDLSPVSPDSPVGEVLEIPAAEVMSAVPAFITVIDRVQERVAHLPVQLQESPVPFAALLPCHVCTSFSF